MGTTLAYAAISRRPFQNVLTDSAVWAVFAAVGGLMSEALARDGDTAIRFCAVVVLVYMTTNILNFLLIAAYHRATAGFRLLSSGKSLYLTMLPSEIATALLTATVAYGYVRWGIGAVALSAVVLVVFQYLVWARAGVRAW